MRKWLEHCGVPMEPMLGYDIYRCPKCGGGIGGKYFYTKWRGLFRA